MKIKITNISFVFKIVLLSSLILIGKISNKAGFQANSLKITSNAIIDTSGFKPVYQQFTSKQEIWKIKNNHY